MTSSFQHGNRTPTASYIAYEKPYNCVCGRWLFLALENECQRVSTGYTGTGSYVESTDTTLALATYAVQVKAVKAYTKC